jgi:putative FmdB family regulatory protein
MPLYDYACATCGLFRGWRAMALYDQPAPCPECGALAPRDVAMPVLGMDWQRKKAHSINERSANEPRTVRRRRGDPMVHDPHADLSVHRQKALARKHSHAHSSGDAHAHRSNHPWMVRH